MPCPHLCLGSKTLSSLGVRTTRGTGENVLKPRHTGKFSALDSGLLKGESPMTGTKTIDEQINEIGVLFTRKNPSVQAFLSQK